MSYKYFLLLDPTKFEGFRDRIRRHQPLIEEIVAAFTHTFVKDRPKGSQSHFKTRWLWDEPENCFRIVTSRYVESWDQIKIGSHTFYYPGSKSTFKKHMNLNDYQQVIDTAPIILKDLVERPDLLNAIDPVNLEESPIDVTVDPYNGFIQISSLDKLEDKRFIPEGSLQYLRKVQ